VFNQSAQLVLGGGGDSEPTEIQGDNMGAIAMVWNPQFHKRSKHIATKWHWI